MISILECLRWGAPVSRVRGPDPGPGTEREREEKEGEGERSYDWKEVEEMSLERLGGVGCG